jgi:hypothetical protein
VAVLEHLDERNRRSRLEHVFEYATNLRPR